MIRKILKEIMIQIEIGLAMLAYIRADEKRIKKAKKLMAKYDKYKGYDFEDDEVKKMVDRLKRMVKIVEFDMRFFTGSSQ